MFVRTFMLRSDLLIPLPVRSSSAFRSHFSGIIEYYDYYNTHIPFIFRDIDSTCIRNSYES